METTRRGRAGIPLALVAGLCVAGLSVSGCGTESPTAPLTGPGPGDPGGGSPAETTYMRQSPPPFLTSSRSPGLVASLLQPVVEWVVVATKWVDADVEQLVTGGRYELRFVPGSLSSDARVTIRQQHADRVLFELGPHGTQFGEPVELVIDFAGTNGDTTCARWDGGGPPELYWLDEETNTWVLVPGKVEGTKVVAELRHFSTYGLARGKSGW